MLEKDIVAEILKWMRGLPLPVYGHKVHGGAYGSGEPDIDACIMGRALKIEVKQPGKNPTPLQVSVMEKWEKAGAIVGCAHSLDEAKAIVLRLLKTLPTSSDEAVLYIIIEIERDLAP